MGQSQPSEARGPLEWTLVSLRSPEMNRSDMPARPAALWFVIAAYLICAGLAAWYMPTSEEDQRWPPERRARYSPPDEGAHLGYVQYLIEHRALPIFDDPDVNYEAHQPPLYYVLCIPPYLLGTALARIWGGSHVIGGLLAMRFWSVLIGAAAIWSVHALGMLLFRGNRTAALMAAGFAALLPMHFVNLGGVTNDGLAELAVTVCLIWACKLAATSSDRTSLIVGLLIGAAMLVKSNSAFLFFVAAIAVILGTRSIQDEKLRLKRILRQYGLVLAASVLLCGWWWIRNQVLYGDPLAHRVFVELFSINRATPEFFLEYGISGTGYLMLLLWGTALSFWGVFGQAIVYMPPWFYLLGWLFSLAVLVGLVRSRWTATTIWSQAALSWLLVVVAAAFVLAFYLRFNMIFYQVQARYLFTAIGPFSCLFVAGWIGLWVRKAAGQAYDAEPLLAAKVLWWALLGVLALVALWHLRPTSVMLGLPFLSM